MISRNKLLRTFRSCFFPLIGSAVILAGPAFADIYTWNNMTTIPAGQYWSAAVSNDGSTIVGSGRNSYIYRSSDAGATWTQAAGTAVGSYFFAMSSDGTKIIAVGNEGGSNYTSTNSGVTWVSRTLGVVPQGRPCMTEDGQNMMAMTWGGIPRLSTDGGATWANAPGLTSAYWVGCAFSFDGTVRYALQSSSSTFKRSVDSGATWLTTTLPSTSWSDIGISRDGSVVYVNSTTRIYKSVDYGQTFTWVNQTTTMASVNYIAVSGDGSRIIAFEFGGSIRISSDGGSTWTSETSPGTNNWYAGDISDDGAKIVAPVANNGFYIWKNGFTLASRISLTSGSNTVITYRAQNTISATTNFAGKVTFFANGKRIGKCISVPTVSLVATCNYKPTVHGPVTITATFVPTNVAYAATSSELFRTKISVRTNNR
jgi:hypothetical protein